MIVCMAIHLSEVQVSNATSLDTDMYLTTDVAVVFWVEAGKADGHFKRRAITGAQESYPEDVLWLAVCLICTGARIAIAAEPTLAPFQ